MFCFVFKRTGVGGVQRYLCVQLYDSRCTGISWMESVCTSGGGGVIRAMRSMRAMLEGGRKPVCRLCRSFCVSAMDTSQRECALGYIWGPVCEGNLRE